MKKLALSSLMIGLLFVVITGCSFFAPSRQTFTVTASEPDAKIYVNGEFIGQGNVQTQVKRNRNVAVLVKKNGYYPAQRSVDKSLSPCGIVDIFGGCCIVVPFLGLLAPGAWQLQEHNITVLLDPIQTNRAALQQENE